MSYRCLLPFTTLKLLRVLLCYLLPTLMHLGEQEGGTAAAAAAAADGGGNSGAAGRAAGDAAAAVPAVALGEQDLLQRLLQLCCFLSLVLAMWGLAVVFVATRHLLKPFNIGNKQLGFRVYGLGFRA